MGSLRFVFPKITRKYLLHILLKFSAKDNGPHKLKSSRFPGVLDHLSSKYQRPSHTATYVL